MVKDSDSFQIQGRQVSPLAHVAGMHLRRDGGQSIFREVMSTLKKISGHNFTQMARIPQKSSNCHHRHALPSVVHDRRRIVRNTKGFSLFHLEVILPSCKESQINWRNYMSTIPDVEKS